MLKCRVWVHGQFCYWKAELYDREYVFMLRICQAEMNVLAKSNSNTRGQSSPFRVHLHQYFKHEVSYQGFYLHVMWGIRGQSR